MTDTADPVHREFDDRPVRDLTLHEVLENRAAALGDSSFLHLGESGASVSFEELNDRAETVAAGLAGLGVTQGDVVSTLMADKPTTLAVLFGCAKLGAVYAPVNTEYQGDPLSYQLGDSTPAVLLVEAQFLSRLNEVAPSLDPHPDLVVYDAGAGESESPDATDGAAATAGAEAADTAAVAGDVDDRFTVRTADEVFGDAPAPPDVDVTWDDAAWIMYTSGTTGLPKGVVLSHRYVLLNHSGVKALQFDRDDVIHNWMPLYHIGGASGQIAAALQAGASVALWDGFSRSQFWDRLERYGATSVTLLTVMLEWLRNAPDADDYARNTITKLQVGELPTDYVDIAEQFGIDFVNVSYSQTEIGAATWGVITPLEAGAGTPESLYRGRSREDIVERMHDRGIPVVDRVPGDDWTGRPRSELYEVVTLDDRDERTDPGENGELAVRPHVPGVMMYRYLNKPEKVVEDTRNLWLHTDDVGVVNEDGDVFFVDRKGNIIRRRGENISSEQYDDIVYAHEKVDTAAVFPVPSDVRTEDDIAVVVSPIEGASLTADEVREYLSTRVAEFMMPQYVEVVSDVPVTETNKVQKAELRRRLFE